MGTLQSRLDADFLLAHMCSVKFKEWIVVLATLLRRSEVCTLLLITFVYMFGNFTHCILHKISFYHVYPSERELSEAFSYPIK